MATIKANLSSIARLNRGGASPSPAKLAAPTTPHAPGTPTPPMPHRSSALAAAAASPPSSPAGGGGAAGGVRGQQNSQGDPEAQGKARMQVLLEAFYRQDPIPLLRLFLETLSVSGVCENLVTRNPLAFVGFTEMGGMLFRELYFPLS